MHQISDVVRQSPNTRLAGAVMCLILASPVTASAPAVSLIPKPRPTAPDITAAVISAIVADQQSGPSPRISLIPRARPANLRTVALTPPKKKFRRKGSVCGVRAIRGATLKRLRTKTAGCGIKNPVRVTSVAGVTLSTPATIDCTTAKALHKWVVKSAEPTFRGQDGGLLQLRIAASYACRTRNSRKGAKISEHGKGRAVDISGFRLANGTQISVLKGWNSVRFGPELKRLHKSACGTFGTVLGPRADVHHRDHFHFDTARYRKGAFCR